MFTDYTSSIADRFCRYAEIDTQSNPASETQPSSSKQLDLSRLLKDELNKLGLTEIELDEFGYLFATIPSNTSKQVPVICFCAHVDTSPDCLATGVKPLLHKNYSGADIILPDDPEQVIRINDHPYLKEKIGDDIITASGKTLLGADDKAGVAIIMEFAAFLSKNQEIKHGKIRLLFTMDGSEIGSFEEETFSADGMKVIFHGISCHPGNAKNKLVNALKMAASFIEDLPADEFSPETTDGRYGFVHPVK